MLYITTLIELLMAFYGRNSKLINILLFITMIFIIGFSYGTADFTIYEGRYNFYNIDFLSNQTEPLYTLIMKVFNALGFPYRLFLIIESIYMISIYFWFVKKLTSNVNYVFLMYIIWPFCRDAVVLRTTLGSTLLYVALYYYLNYDISHHNTKKLNNSLELILTKRKKMLLFCFFLLMAGMIHFSMLFYYILLVPMLFDFKDRETDIFFNSLVLMVAFIAEVILFNFILQLPLPEVLMNKIEFVLNRSEEAGNILKAPGALRTIFMFCLYLGLHFQLYADLKRQNDKLRMKVANRILYCNMYQLLVIPFYGLMPDLARLQQVLMLLNYVEFSFFFGKSCNGRYTTRELVFFLETVMYAVIYLFIIVLKTEQFDSVFRALFEKNILFSNN